jgi:hypothetical protein
MSVSLRGPPEAGIRAPAALDFENYIRIFGVKGKNTLRGWDFTGSDIDEVAIDLASEKRQFGLPGGPMTGHGTTGIAEDPFNIRDKGRVSDNDSGRACRSRALAGREPNDRDQGKAAENKNRGVLHPVPPPNCRIPVPRLSRKSS